MSSADNNYEEDLSKNKLFIKYKNDHGILIETAAINNWVICIPRNGSVQTTAAIRDEKFLLSHVLIPDNEIPDFCFINLLGDKYERKDGTLIQVGKESNSISKEILFEDFYYTQDLIKLRIWCLSGSIVQDYNNDTIISTVETIQDAISFIQNETEPYLFKVIKSICYNYLNEKKHYGNQRADQKNGDLQNDLKQIFDKCIEIILTRKSFRQKFEDESIKLQNLRKSVMIVILFLLHDYCFDQITNRSHTQSEAFNKNLQKMIHLSTEDLCIGVKFLPLLPNIREEILLLKERKTPIEKVCCLKKIMQSEQGSDDHPTLDDLIPLIAYSIVQSSYTHWITVLAYISELLPLFEDFNSGYKQFLLSTLEAAICYITNWTPPKMQNPIGPNYVYKSKEEFLEKFFHLISNNNEKGVLDLLNIPLNEEDDILKVISNKKTLFTKIQIEQQLDLCHPLCTCSKCHQKIIQHLPNINSTNERGQTGIHIAAKNGYPKLISILLSLGADVNACDLNGLSALHYAAIAGHQNVLLLLLNSKADLTRVTADGYTILHLSTQYGHTRCVKAFLFFIDHMNIKFNVNKQDQNGNTALHIACKWGYTEIVEALMEYKANRNLQNKMGELPVNLCHNNNIKSILSAYDPICVQQKQLRITKEIEHAVNAIKNRDFQLFRYYIGIDSEKENLDEGKMLPIELIDDIENSTSKSNLVIKNGKYKGKSLLYYAIVHDCPEIFNDLLNFGFSVDNEMEHDGRTILHAACKERNVNYAVNILKYVTADVINKQDCLGNTALHYAVTYGNWEITQNILQYNCNTQIRNKQGLTPIDIGKKKNYLNIVALLQKIN